MRALLHDPSGVEDHDLIGTHDRSQPVRDHQHRAPHRQARQRFLDIGFGLRVGERGCLVEHENRSVRENRTRDGDSLGFTTRESGVDPDHRVVPPRERFDSGVDLRGCGSGLHLGRSRLRSGKPNVVEHGRFDQLHVLQNESDVAVQLVGSDFPDVDTTDGHGSGTHVVEPRNQRCQRRLTRTRRSDQRRHRALRQRQIDAGQDVGAVVVCKGDSGESNFVPHRLFRMIGFRQSVGCEQRDQSRRSGGCLTASLHTETDGRHRHRNHHRDKRTGQHIDG